MTIQSNELLFVRKVPLVRAMQTDGAPSASAIVADVLPAIERELAELATAELEGEAGAV